MLNGRAATALGLVVLMMTTFHAQKQAVPQTIQHALTPSTCPQGTVLSSALNTCVAIAGATQEKTEGHATSRVSVDLQRMTPEERKVFARDHEAGASNGSGEARETNCYYTATTDSDSVTAHGGVPGEGFVLTRMCGGQLSLTGSGSPSSREIYLPDGTSYVRYDDPDPQIPAATPPSPQDFLEDAVGELELPAPDIQIGPDPNGAVVNLPMWFWVGGETEHQATAGLDGGVGVVVTAKLKSVTWNFGEPVEKPGIGSSTSATMTCVGAGSPAPSMDELSGIPPLEWKPECGHAFRWKSTKERTGNKGAWTVTATVTWDVSWESTGITPAVGGTVDDVPPTQGTVDVQVLEQTDRLVDNPNAPVTAGPERQPGG